MRTRVTISFKHETLSSVVKKLEDKAAVTFAFDEAYLRLADKYVGPGTYEGQTLEAILSALMPDQGIGFKEQGSNIILFKQANGTVNGRVTDETGEPLPGAIVRVKGTSIGVSADANGAYRISLPEGSQTLMVSFVGYAPVNVSVQIIGNRSTVSNITLQSGSTLQEINVSYGKQRAKEVTGSIVQLDAKQLEDMPVGQFAQQLQGKVAGVQIAQSSGQPGRGVEFRIRGAASFYASNQPLIIVDGIPVTGSINNINPNEIESYSVLKDASATALYGSRAANGVILITTKHAKPGDSKIVFNAGYGVQKIPQERVPKMMDARGFAQYMKEKFEDARKYEPGYTTATPAEYLNPEQYGEGTNWYDLLTRAAPFQNYDLTVQSARENSSSTVIVGYQEQEGVLINTGTKLYTLRINQDLSLLNNRLKIGFNIAPSYRLDHNNRLTTDGVGGLFERIFEASPLKSPYNPDGSYNRDTYSAGMVAYINPLAQFNLTQDDYKTTRILGNAYLNYEFVKGLSLKTNFAVDKGNESRKYYQSGVVTSTVGQATGTAATFDNGSYTGEANLVYSKTIATDHNIEVLGGYSVQKYSGYNTTLTGLGFPDDNIPYLSAATSLSAGNSTYSAYSLLSSIARVNYNFKGRYLLQGAVRRDGSSRFGDNQKYGTFPSVSAGWVVSDESFMKNIKSVDLFKIRASYGITGNNFFGNYEAQATLGKYYYAGNGTSISGQSINRLENANLRWERNKQFDIGLDLSLLKNRLNFTYDYYRKVSDGLIMQRPVPRASGFLSIVDNVGVIELWGHEFSVNSTNLTGKLGWTTNFNISFDRNIIKELVDPGYIRRNNTVSSDYFRQQEGHHLGEFYGFVFQGLYKDAADLASSAKYGTASDVGTIKVKDINGDGVIDDGNDRTFIGDPTPTFTGGLTNNFTYGNWDLNIHMSYSVGGEILNAAKWAYQTNLDGSRLMLAAAADRWRSPENPGSGIYPRTKTGTTAMGRQVNSQWIENGSYLTLKNVSLGYRINLKNPLVKSLRVFGSVQQAFVITGYSGLNPEINFAGQDPTLGIGVDENAYPVPRTFSFGLSATFK
ncbi:TonB-linked outer membrane protein, SusC/RagA family [Pedobacter westerhofensis]|uniref:TonB-linked outer membrane protein, SusC/RagA family n=1 Tax=Pedobacter westerhofensis TaxID=425512 RepID=A0A521AFZ6_9SPHI|nr:TonB-dependent receptor [Pedobacter westerhofensis]SMO33630.1 TonB-linked outer membrane protein, SusC/RagA family [Pedobacter westerhofensis]